MALFISRTAHSEKQTASVVPGHPPPAPPIFTTPSTSAFIFLTPTSPITAIITTPSPSVGLLSISSVVAISIHHAAHFEAQPAITSSGPPLPSLPILKSPSTFLYILTGSIHPETVLATPVSPFVASFSVSLPSISSVVAISIFPTAHSGAQATMAPSGPPLPILLILKSPSTPTSALLVSTPRITTTATTVSPSIFIPDPPHIHPYHSLFLNQRQPLVRLLPPSPKYINQKNKYFEYAPSNVIKQRLAVK